MSHLAKVQKHAHEARRKLHEQFPHAHQKLTSLNFNLKDIRRHSAKMLYTAALVGGLILATPVIKTAVHPARESIESSKASAKILQEQLHLILSSHTGNLSPNEEYHVSQAIQETLGIRATAELDGHRLNNSIGRIGGEQHLPRFPGDTISQHDDLQVKGITAGRGAFGYFAPTKDALTAEAQMQEKYYVAVQTLYLPDWNRNYKELKEWYKFRKVLVINPTTGKSVIAVIGDAGPAAWTGKQFGGSPELMEYLQPYKNKNNGTVLLFFIDDQQNALALGPVENHTNYIAKR